MTVLEAASHKIAHWRTNPKAFVFDNFGIEPDEWQRDVLQAFADPLKPRISLQACAGPGKTAVLAWCAWNFLSCYAERGEHPKGAAVSVNEKNLADNLWPELEKWRDRSDFLKKAFTWNRERIASRDFPNTWFLSARSWPKTASADEQGKTLSGLHSRFPIFLIDESGNIPETVLRAAEQALSNCHVGKIVQAGNPISREGMLYAAATRLASLWTIVRITGDPDDSKRSPRIGVEWARRQIQMYGRENPWVMSYILGQFPPSSLNSLLSDEEVTAAMGRSLPPADAYNWAQPRIGVDVARFGDDRTCLFPRQGVRLFEPTVMRHARDTAVSTDIATKILDVRSRLGDAAVIMDATGGWAAGARDVLKASGYEPVSIQFHAKGLDARYKNRRAELWFTMAEAIKAGACLPNIPDLIAELTTPTYSWVGGAFMLEAKEQVKERLGRSPDLADALALSYGLPEIKVIKKRSVWLSEPRVFAG